MRLPRRYAPRNDSAGFTAMSKYCHSEERRLPRRGNLLFLMRHNHEMRLPRLLTKRASPLTLRRTKHLFLSDVTAQHILDFYAFLKKTRSVKNITLKHYASVLRPALKSAFKDKLITENPFDFYLP